MLRTNIQMFSDPRHQCRHRQMCCVHTFIHYTHFLSVTKKRLVLIEQSIHGKVSTHWDVHLMLRTNYRCLQSLNISVDDAKCVENVHKFTQFTHFCTLYFLLSVQKMTCPHFLSVPKTWLNNLFMARFQLNRMSTYVKNKLQMCSVTQHQCRRRQMCGEMFTNSPSSLTFCPLQNTTCPDWTIYSWQGLNSLGSAIMLRTNYSCVQLVNINVDVA